MRCKYSVDTFRSFIFIFCPVIVVVAGTHTHTNVTRTSSGCALNYRARNLMHAFLIAFSHYILLAGIWVFYYFI